MFTSSSPSAEGGKVLVFNKKSLGIFESFYFSDSFHTLILSNRIKMNKLFGLDRKSRFKTNNYSFFYLLMSNSAKNM